MRSRLCEPTASFGSAAALRLGVVVVGVVWCVTLSACKGPTLPATPNLYADRSASPFGGVPADLRGTAVPIVYATDRQPIERESGGLTYGAKRANSLAFGRCMVDIGGDLTWDDLVEASLDPKASVRVPVEVTSTEELFRFPSAVTPLTFIDGVPVEDPAVTAARAEARAEVLEALSRGMARVPRKEVFVYVHGIHNGFEDPIILMAQLWHMMGRVGMPVVYTWPANPDLGPLRGYTHDRESGEFTVFHLREFLRLLADCPEIERVNILAHSRGTDVTMTALRELHLQAQGSGVSTRDMLKLGNVVLAAPDLDLGVTVQRLRPDRVHTAPSRLTMYVSKTDKAIGISGWLFSSASRLGRLTAKDLTDDQRAQVKERGVFDIVEAKVKKRGSYGHSYFIDNPAVLSDLILLLRDDRPPGAKHGRPLTRREDGFYEIRDDYLLGD